jgi:DNA-3-methyladenine glycosylase I
MSSINLNRCPWCGSDPLYQSYHDQEWGVPQHDDRKLFEFLILEGAQAGLSWLTILRKRENYRKALDQFDPEKLARYGDKDIQRLMGDPGIVRNRLKIDSMVRNARGCLAIQEEFGSLDHYLWRFVAHQPIQNSWRTMAEIPAKTAISDQLSQDLKTHFTP